jgi:hypothetical protein
VRVICVDPSVTRGKLCKGAVYEVTEIISDSDGDFFRLVETGQACWFTDRFRPFGNPDHFLSGADIASGQWDNRRKQEERA